MGRYRREATRGRCSRTPAARADWDSRNQLCVVSFVSRSSDDSDSLLEFLFAQEICFGGGRGMASVITTGWHLWVIKGGGSASKELTLPALTFTKVEIKAPLQTIYGNSNVQSATVFVRCLALTHAHAYTYTSSGTLTRGLCVQQMTSKCCTL